jgi:hypothetical protein
MAKTFNISKMKLSTIDHTRDYITPPLLQLETGKKLISTALDMEKYLENSTSLKVDR